MTRAFWASAGLGFLFNAFLFTWLLLKPGTHEQFMAVDNVAQTVGLLLGALLCFVGFQPPRWPSSSRLDVSPGARSAQWWVPLLLGLGIFSMCLGQGTYTYYEQVLRQQPAPFPSWADAGYLGVYPFLLLGILFLPGRALSSTTRWRVMLDGLMIMAAVITFSWYFILGPTMLQGYDTLFAKLVGAAYPIADLIMVFCLLLLFSRSSESRLRAPICLLALSLVIIVLTDSLYDYQTLQNAYVTGGLVDLGWPLGYILMGLAVQAMRVVYPQLGVAAETQADQGFSGKAPPALAPVWRALLPYALVPALVLLVVSVWHSGGNGPLAQGVYLGGAVLLGLVVVRQLLAIRETQLLNRALQGANRRLEAMATTDPLTGLSNHRALLDQLDKEVERARRYGRTVSIAFFDGDRFKLVNDTYGHSTGDVVLCELGER